MYNVLGSIRNKSKYYNTTNEMNIFSILFSLQNKEFITE